MSKELIVSVNGREKKIAIVEDDLVTEFYVERGDENQGIVGNIYKGRVMKVLPGMQSAFVDIGLERDSFLYVSDFFDEEDEEGSDEKKDARPARVERPERIDGRVETRSERPAERSNERPAERTSERSNERSTERLNDRTAERPNDRSNERMDRPDRSRPAGRGPARPEPVVAPDEDEEDNDLQLTALKHIEELTSEPVMEPAPDDEPTENHSRESSARLNPRQRRQRRLQYVEPDEETVPEPIVPAPDEEETVEVEAPPVEAAEADEETTGRRGGGNNRRPARRPRRRSGEDRATEKPVAVSEAGETSQTSEPSKPGKMDSDAAKPAPYILVQHDFERVTDDDLAETEGDLLREAMMQQRVAATLQREDRRVEILDFEPTPEVQVGSLQNFAAPSGFERISDSDEAEEPSASARPSAAEAPSSAPSETDESAPPQPTADEQAGEPADGNAQNQSETQAGHESASAPKVDDDSAAAKPAHQYRVVEVDEDVQVIHLESSDAPDAVDAADRDGASPQTAGATKESQAEGDAIEPSTDREADGGAPTEAPTEASAEVSSPEEVETPEPLPETSARVRGRGKRGEMATRRGGRGRGRTAYRRSATTDATADADEFQDDGEDDDDEADDFSATAPAQSPALAPAPSSAARAPERTASRPSNRPPERSHERYSRPVITDLLREGQEVIVQIAKEPIGQKGARITSHVALPGRYIVYMPTVEHIGVSRKIGTDEDRLRLKRALQQFRAEAGAPGGFIVRTAAATCTLDELREDMQYLVRTWTDIRRRSERVKAPAIAHRDLDLVQRILRDQLSSDFTTIRVDNEQEYERMVDFVNRFAPKLVHRVKLYTKDTPILEAYGVQAEIDKAVKPRVWLRSGGYIVINQTEALVAIDVNTGKFVGKSNRLEDTITKTNLEAAKEIVRQIRLRDLGGIIVLDFIDMEERRNRAKVMSALEQELRNDRSPSKILQFNDFGLVAITRKRVKQSLERTLCTPCAYCGGAGMVKSAQTICYEILSESRRISKDIDPANEVILRVNPEVAKALRQAERDVLGEIESYLGGVVTIKSDPTVHQEQFDIALA